MTPWRVATGPASVRALRAPPPQVHCSCHKVSASSACRTGKPMERRQLSTSSESFSLFLLFSFLFLSFFESLVPPIPLYYVETWGILGEYLTSVCVIPWDKCHFL
ncbi:putative formin-like protein 3 isoform X1 [Iris pallida]|uniref:Formin-like protein 3 isoform X1 n=1 Tax=Iris pallida TaxID=29817 RepID=A0AAX6E7G4_IRIPA|nr:putative formin-like protein 3 isoform X1 [Iris pallida]